MELTPYQFIAPAISLVAIVYAWNLVLRQKKTLWEAVLWTIFWGAIAVFALYPDVLSYLSQVTGIKDRENAVLVTFLGVLTFVIFSLIIRVEDLSRRQAQLARAISLRDAGLQQTKDTKD